MKVNIDHIIETSEKIEVYIRKLEGVEDLQILMTKPNHKSWSVLEVIAHLNKVYSIYFPNFKIALEHAEGHVTKQKSTFLGTLSRKAMRPKGDKRRWKMKTFTFFEPKLDSSQAHEVFQQYYRNKTHYHKLLETAKTGRYNQLKVSSSVGSWVKFYFLEALDFLQAHEERHIVQIREILKRVKEG